MATPHFTSGLELVARATLDDVAKSGYKHFKLLYFLSFSSPWNNTQHSVLHPNMIPVFCSISEMKAFKF